MKLLSVNVVYSERRAFGLMCNVTKEPEDVTVGYVVGKKI